MPIGYAGAPRPFHPPGPVRAQHYVHRNGPWNSLQNAIHSNNDGQKVIIVAGMTGTGKTQLVTEALRVYNPENNPKCVFTPENRAHL